MEHTLNNWAVGLGIVSLLLGSLITYIVWLQLHAYFNAQRDKKGWQISEDYTQTVPLFPILAGVLERIFFTVMIAFQISGVGGAIVAWVGIKLAVGWGSVKEGKTPNRALAFVGLLSSLTSIFFAVIGGLICNGSIRVCK